MKLLIRNLAKATKESDLKTLFEKYGKVQYCTIVKDRESTESKGFAFVEMPRVGDAKAATKNLNGKEVDGNKLRVKKAQPKAKDSKTSKAPEKED